MHTTNQKNLGEGGGIGSVSPGGSIFWIKPVRATCNTFSYVQRATSCTTNRPTNSETPLPPQAKPTYKETPLPSQSSAGPPFLPLDHSPPPPTGSACPSPPLPAAPSDRQPDPSLLLHRCQPPPTGSVAPPLSSPTPPTRFSGSVAPSPPLPAAPSALSPFRRLLLGSLAPLFRRQPDPSLLLHRSCHHKASRGVGEASPLQRCHRSPHRRLLLGSFPRLLL